MSTNDPFMDPPGTKRIPGSINTLTILTFIGCGIGLLGSIYTFTGAKSRYDTISKMMEDGSMENMPGFMKGMMGPDMLEVLRKTYENRVPILITTVVGIALCLYGAIEMRKLKKQGFYMWLLGELLPIICTFIFIGAAAFRGFGMIGLIIPLLFVILYATQLKYMK